MKKNIKKAIQIIADTFEFQKLCIKWLFEGEMELDDSISILEVVAKCRKYFPKQYEEILNELGDFTDDDADWDILYGYDMSDSLIKSVKKSILNKIMGTPIGNTD